ncbi:hypothetical protein JW911_01675 [Candidatus Peregrinibacteria bacterium]|nr:hypothetical protein [Candidatus Peregrinibacteria bacterium]
MKAKKLLSVVIPVAVILAVAAAAFYYIQLRPQKESRYQAPQTIVSEKISSGADIIVNLPKEAAGSTENIEFSPEIEGEWHKGAAQNVVILTPDKPLEQGMVYQIKIPAKEGEFKQFFEITEPPKVLNIFPNKDTETPVNSKITMVFNRPMIPLTTLGEVEKNTVPVEMTPKTTGRWKWISTRSLQFIPADSLVSSANYTVKTLPEFTSFEGLKIESVEHTFNTTPLRYERIDTGKIVYNKPINIYFNQPVDIEKTKSHIEVFNNTSAESADILVEYGKRSMWNNETHKYEEKTDNSVLAVYQAQDSHGRSKLWDFANVYNLEILKAYPLEGDIVLDEKNTSTLTVTEIVKNVSAHSERSFYATKEFLDPKGYLEIEFYEETDLGRSRIEGDKTTNIEYGKKCKEQEAETEKVIWSTDDTEEEKCEEITDKTKLRVFFQSGLIDFSEKLSLKIKKIVNVEGVTLNPQDQEIEYTLYAYPKFEIKNVLEEGKQGVDTEKLTVCSSTPLYAPEQEKIDNFIKINPEYKFQSWNSSYYIDPGQKEYPECKPYEFQTDIYYYLKPYTEYKINLDLKDLFDQTASKEITLTTGNIGEILTNIYHLQDHYSVTTSKATKLSYATENLDYVDVQICKVDPLTMLEALNNGLDYKEPAHNQLACEDLKTDQIDIPGNYWARNYFQIRVADYFPETPGHYVLTFTNPDYKGWSDDQIFEHAYLTITNISAIEKVIQAYEYSYIQDQNKLTDKQKEQLENMYWVTDISTLNNISNAKIDLYRYEDMKNSDDIVIARSVSTDENGVAKVKVVTNPAGAIITSGNDSAIIPNYSTVLQYSETAYNTDRIYIYTDRPIYRPGDTVHIKGIYRTGFDNEMKILRDTQMEVSVNDSEYNNVYSAESEINEFGTFSTDYIISSEAPLGRYYIYSNNQTAYFDVEEYTNAAFKVETKTDKEEYTAGEKFTLNIDANYYFGVPLEGGTVNYSIVAQDYYFDKYTDEYFNFGSPWYSCWWGCPTNDTFILRGEKELGKDGKAVITHEMNFEKLFKEEEDRKSKIFVVNLNVENTSGQQISTQKSFIVHAGDVYLGVKTDDYFMPEGKEFEMKAKSVDKDGKPAGKGDIKGSINKVTWKTIQRKEVDGSFYYRTEKELTSIEEFSFSTDTKGNYSKKFTIKEQGEYEIILQTKDSRGNEITTSENVYVYKATESDQFAGEISLVRKTNDTTLEIVNTNGMLKVGDTADFMIKNPFNAKAKALIAIERGRVFDYEIVDVASSFYKHEFEITDDYIPNIYASVVLLSAEPGLKFASTSYVINVEQKELTIDVKSEKEKYLPGEEVNLDITVKDNDGKPVQTELSVAVVDESVLALKGNPHKNPVKFFYAGFPLTVSTSANLKNLLHEIEIKPGKGGGGGIDDTKKRGEFLDTALWQAVIHTDENGTAKVKFNLPDNLTTWQVETIGVSKDTKLGVDYDEIMTQKDLMITPLKPRFAVPGDTFKLGAKIFNQSDKIQNLKVTISSETLSLDGSKEIDLSIGRGETKTVYFNAQAPALIQEGIHKFTLSAKSNEEEDTVEQSISITRDNTYESTATAYYTNEDTATEYIYIPENVIKDKGELNIGTSATLAVFISGGLNSLMDFAYGCTEQIASKLEAIAIVKRGLALENIGEKFRMEEITFEGKKYSPDEVVKIGLSKIYENQNSDGGFTYFKGWESNYHLTLRMITMLNTLNRAGYQVNQNAIINAANYVLGKINTDKAYQTESNIIYAAYAFSNISNNSSYLQELAPKISEVILADEKLLNEELNNMTLTYLALTLAENPNLFNSGDKDMVYKLLENRVKIDARGAYMPLSGKYEWSYYETSQKNTALYLKALTADKRDNETLGNLLRWLLNTREKDGAWGSTAATLAVIDSFTDFIKWQNENKSDFNLTIAVDDITNEFSFNPQTILNQEKVKISPLEKLQIGKILPLTFTKKNNNNEKNNFYYDVLLKYYLPVENIAPRDEGFSITKKLYALDDKKLEKPLAEARIGDILKGRLEIIVPEDRNFVAIENYIPAGTELVNFTLATENESLYKDYEECKNGNAKGCNYDYDPNQLYPRREELRDDRLFLFTDHLSPGTYHYDYYLRALVPGEFSHMPAVVSQMYFPEIFGRTGGEKFIVKE